MTFAMTKAWLSASAQGLFSSPRAWDMGGFALRAWVASMLALYTAFGLGAARLIWVRGPERLLALTTPFHKWA